MRRLPLTAAGRVIVAADFRPSEFATELNYTYKDVRRQALDLCRELEGTGVCIKVNSALRGNGYELIDRIHEDKLAVFADLKLYDIGETLETDAILLEHLNVGILTVACTTGIAAMRALKNRLPLVEVLGVTVPTTFTEEDVSRMFFGASLEKVVLNLATMAAEAGLDGVVCSAKAAALIRREFGSDFSIVTPAIRPKWAVVAGDDQNKKRSVTPFEAIQAGADRIVIGRPIVQAKNRREATDRTMEEVLAAMQS